MKQRLFAFIAILLSFFVVHDGHADHRNILFISSYHPSFHSFMPQVNGINEGLKSGHAHSHNVSIDIEFMDAKRFPGPANLESFRARLALKMQQKPVPDVLLVGDDIAFRFAQSEREQLFAGIPIVFLGVNNVAKALEMNTDPQFTGVVEKASFGATLNLAIYLLQEGGKVYAITDPTRTGEINFDEFTKTEVYQKKLR